MFETYSPAPAKFPIGADSQTRLAVNSKAGKKVFDSLPLLHDERSDKILRRPRWSGKCLRFGSSATLSSINPAFLSRHCNITRIITRIDNKKKAAAIASRAMKEFWREEQGACVLSDQADRGH
jgi:hypothetical protein